MQFQEGDIDGVVVRQIEPVSDSRGWLMELFRSDEIPSDVMPDMCYISMTHPGVSRGPHEHAHQTDMFCFVGPGSFDLFLWDNRSDSATCGIRTNLIVGEENPTLLIVPPGVVHAYRNVGGADAFVLNLPNRLYKGSNRIDPVDEIRHEDDPSSPFKLE